MVAEVVVVVVAEVVVVVVAEVVVVVVAEVVVVVVAEVVLVVVVVMEVWHSMFDSNSSKLTTNIILEANNIVA